MYGCESAELCDDWDSNSLLHPDPPYIVVPLGGLTNHRQPKDLNLDDFISFTFTVIDSKPFKRPV